MSTCSNVHNILVTIAYERKNLITSKVHGEFYETLENHSIHQQILVNNFCHMTLQLSFILH